MIHFDQWRFAWSSHLEHTHIHMNESQLSLCKLFKSWKTEIKSWWLFVCYLLCNISPKPKTTELQQLAINMSPRRWHLSGSCIHLQLNTLIEHKIRTISLHKKSYDIIFVYLSFIWFTCYLEFHLNVDQTHSLTIIRMCLARQIRAKNEQKTRATWIYTLYMESVEFDEYQMYKSFLST